MTRSTTLACALAALSVACASDALGAEGAGGVEIVSFEPPAGPLHPGDTAVAALRVRNGGPAPRRVWIGYSVQDPAGAWHDVPAHPAVLGPGAALLERKGWVLPAGAVPGGYRAVMAVWSGVPGEPGAERLASADRAAAFDVPASLPALHPAGPWVAAEHRLGRGRLRPGLVRPTGAGFALGLRAGSCDGAEVRTRERVHHGTYSVRMRTPRAPGSLSAFFLYEDVPQAEGNDEIDLEILNDGSRRALLNSWIDGRPSIQAEVILPFDPAADFHEYAIRWAPGELAITADGAVLGRWTRGVPQRPMRLMVNAWWPVWLPCAPLPEPRELQVQWVRVRPS